MNNLNSIVDYLKVFNNIETYKKPEPRNMYAGGQLVAPTVDGSRPGYNGKDVTSEIPKKYTDDLLEKRITINPRGGPTSQAVTVGEIFEKVNNVEGGPELIADFKKNPTEEKFITLRKKYKNRVKTERIQNLSTKEKAKYRQKVITSERKWRKSEKGQAYYRKYMAEKGIFPANTPEERIWRDIYRAAGQKKDARFEIKFSKNIEINPETGLPKAVKSSKGKMYVPWDKHYKDISFVDKETGQIIKFDGVKQWMKNNVPNGVKKYNNAIENYALRQNISDIEVKGQTLGDIYKKNKIAQGATPNQVKLASPAAVNHRSGLNNFWDTEVITTTANNELNDKIQSKISAYKNASPNIKTKIFKQMEVAANKIKGGGTLVIDRQILGKEPTPKKVMASLGKELNIKGLFKTYQNAGIGKNCKAYGGRVGFGEAGVVGVSKCMDNAIQEHNKNLQSKDISVKNAARAKQYGILKNANKLKGVKNLLQMGRKGFQAITGTVGTVTGGWGGVALEAAIEGLFYEHYRRAGYNDKQAQAETFFYKMMDPDRETGVWEGAEDLLKDELVGQRDEEGYLKSAQPHGESWFDVGADKYQTQKDALEAEIATNSKLDFELRILKNQYRPGSEEEIAAKEQEINDSYDRLEELEITLKQGTPEQEAYARAEEKQKALQDRRSEDWEIKKALLEGSIESAEEYERPETYYKEKEKQHRDEFLEYKGAKQKHGVKLPFSLEEDWRDEEGRKKRPITDPYAYKETDETLSDIAGYLSREQWEEIKKANPDYADIAYEDLSEKDKWNQYKYWVEKFPGTPASRYGWDLMGKVAEAGGVSKMATGGIMNLKKW